MFPLETKVFSGVFDPTYLNPSAVPRYTRSYGAGDYDVWLIKTDSNGKTKNKPLDKQFFAKFLDRLFDYFPLLARLIQTILF